MTEQGPIKENAGHSPEEKAKALAVTMFNEVQGQNPDPVLVDGIEIALRFYPRLHKSIAGEDNAHNFVRRMFEGDMEQFEEVEPIELSEEEKKMFRSCQGGVNKKTQEKLREFFGTGL